MLGHRTGQELDIMMQYLPEVLLYTDNQNSPIALK